MNAADDRHERGLMAALAAVPGLGPASLLVCRYEVGAARAWAAVQAGTVHAIPALARIRGSAASVDGPAAPTGTARLPPWLAGADPAAVLERYDALGIDVLVHGLEPYPDRLLDDPLPPAVLFARGALEASAMPSVAIVGTRNATRSGCEFAASLAVALVDRGISVVSGLALGIDGAAHRAVCSRLEAAATPGSSVPGSSVPGSSVPGSSVPGSSGPQGPCAPLGSSGRLGRPLGVVAAGLDRPYPRRHAGLHRQVGAAGIVLSETPLGGAPTPWRFPARNRLIAGLSDAVVVVESRSRGGSMLTAAEALTRDVPVLAVPGHPTAPGAAGCLDLIADGAAPVRDVDDVLVAIGLGGRMAVTAAAPPEAAPPLGADARAVLDALVPHPLTLGDLVSITGLGIEQVAAALMALEADGSVSRAGPWFEQTGRSHGTRSGRGSRQSGAWS